MKGRAFPAWQSLLSGHPCPYKPCDGRLAYRQFPDYETSLGIVPLATVNVCTTCGGHVVTEYEWRRFQAALHPHGDL